MNLLACGINHQTAPITVREQTVITPDNIPGMLKNLLQLDAVNEAMVLSTCNRTEFYLKTEGNASIIHWLCDQYKFPKEIPNPYLYAYQDESAVQHVMRVASGLDSMVLGEPQILGQMKQAFSVANKTGTIGKHLWRLFSAVFSVGKQVRTHTDIGVNPVSVAYIAVNYAEHIFADLPKATVLLIGAGETIELAGFHLRNHGVRRIIVANRSIGKAKNLAEKYQGQGIVIGEVPIYLPQADIVISATASQLPILGKGAVERAIKVRKHKPMLMIDVAMPRDIEPEVSELDDVYLYNMDDLQKVVEKNKKYRQNAAKQAEEIIRVEATHFMRELRAAEESGLIRRYRDKINLFKDEELKKAMAQLKRGAVPEEVLVKLAHGLVNKVMHAPTVEMRQAAYHNQADLLVAAKRLLNID